MNEYVLSLLYSSVQPGTTLYHTTPYHSSMICMMVHYTLFVLLVMACSVSFCWQWLILCCSVP